MIFEVVEEWFLDLIKRCNFKKKSCLESWRASAPAPLPQHRFPKYAQCTIIFNLYKLSVPSPRWEVMLVTLVLELGKRRFWRSMRFGRIHETTHITSCAAITLMSVLSVYEGTPTFPLQTSPIFGTPPLFTERTLHGQANSRNLYCVKLKSNTAWRVTLRN